MSSREAEVSRTRRRRGSYRSLSYMHRKPTDQSGQDRRGRKLYEQRVDVPDTEERKKCEVGMNKNALHFPELLESLVALDTEMQRDRAGAKIIEGWEQILLVFFTLFSPCPPFTYSSPFCSFVFRVRFSCGLFLFSFLLFVSLCPLLCYLCFSYPLDSYPFYFYFSSSRL